ncbi:hypothetical protein AB6A40_003492 [Gnathostoma spinigerum]|uniref:Galectin domain-containing protein n=1 Tax=Gnathostoma spinigerum TaxID=75299 RepID=A0ABD6EIJ3_9BILA
MRPFLVTLSVLCGLSSVASNCECHDRSWCAKNNYTERWDQVDCPVKYNIFECVAFTEENKLEFERASNYTGECREGWMTPSPTSVGNGSPSTIRAMVPEGTLYGSSSILYIDADGWNAESTIVIKSAEWESIPMFIRIIPVDNTVIISDWMNGKWCSERAKIFNRPPTQKWQMRLRFWSPYKPRQQVLDVHFDVKENGVDGRLDDGDYLTLRYFMRTRVKKGDWFTFSEGAKQMKSLTWSHLNAKRMPSKKIQFKSSPPTGSTISILGLLPHYAKSFHITIDGVDEYEYGLGEDGPKIVITGYLHNGESRTNIYGYGNEITCGSSDSNLYVPGQAFSIIIKVNAEGITLHMDGKELCTFTSEQFRARDIREISVVGSMKALGFGSNLCEEYAA